MKITKVEHHSVNWHYVYDLDQDKLEEIYPDLTTKEIKTLMRDLKAGDACVEDVIEHAWENSVDIEWDLEYEDVWTDRKGGYDITYGTGE